MKCPLLQRYYIQGNEEGSDTIADCLREECAWWNRGQARCAVYMAGDNLLTISCHLGGLANLQEQLPYVGLDGYLFSARRSGRPYSLRSRPMTPDERESMQLEKQDHGWISECILHDTNQVFTGLGIVTHDEMTETSRRDPSKLRSPVVAAHPWQLAQKRSEWQALRRGFPLGVDGEPPVVTMPPAAAVTADPAQAQKNIEELWPESK